ncbi:MAG TPA: 4-hydroxy-tetrahydrodipicolinate reductase [Rhodobacteraceae bacterium]|jgi:4-hydroxy-tetrahydrodipicolinate reductase|nr:4-hydroxy-tetrahydrodipicolinate reductase [Paracoccaceae bacterium]HBG98202.1 4-hydroxy-tetrahydrodipicolinate reductase [Paracoccaceae bacterium]
MTATTPIAVTGAAGRMGRMLIDMVTGSPAAALVAVTEAPGHPWIGRDLGECLGRAPIGITVGDDPVAAVAVARALIDFTTPEASLANAALAAQARIVHVIGTTGLDDADLPRLQAAARHAVIVQSGNTSLGVNLLVEITRQVAAVLGPEYDIEVVEAHHRHKVDAPSGTALMLGEAAAAGRGAVLAEIAERGRDGPDAGPRAPGAIGFSAIRGGDVVGEHDVIFAGPGERVVLRHISHDRALFARGALRAALWGQGHKPGLYAMRDVLGLG